MAQLFVAHNQSRYSDEAVLEAARFVAPRSLTGPVAIIAKGARGRVRFSGWAFTHRREVVVRIAHPSQFPWRGRPWGSQDEIVLPTARQALVHTLAHELRHLEQARRGRPLDEQDANRYARRQLERWLRRR